MTTAKAIARAHQLLPDLLRECAARFILPRWRQLDPADVREKAPRELVTSVDLAVEAAIQPFLADLTPGSVCIGEEAASDNPDLLHALPGDRLCWLVDPLDGTRNFVEGRESFAVMVAAVQHGETLASWILHPVTGALYSAEAGEGARRDEVALACPKDNLAPEHIVIGAHTGFLPPDLAAHMQEPLRRYRDHWVYGSAGHEYPAVVEGHKSVMLAWRILPWDHAPGALLVREAGGSVLRPDGQPYGPAQPGSGLVAATTKTVALDAISLLFP